MIESQYYQKVMCGACNLEYTRIDWIKLSPVVGLRVSAYDYIRSNICLKCIGEALKERKKE